MYFASDNWAGAHPAITAALAEHGGGAVPSYGSSDLDEAVSTRFSELFERDVAVFPVATGTAANSLALAAFARPGGKIFAHAEAHIVDSECGAPEYFTSGARMATIAGEAGRMGADDLEAALRTGSVERLPAGQSMAVSISQLTESGTAYSLDEIRRLADLAHERELPLHMDGARFANALVALDCSPADMTWRSGVDVLSFGATKNGCWCAEAVVFFDPVQAAGFEYLRKRGAQLFSKMRFVSAQFDAYLTDDLWLTLAAHANRAADQMRAAIEQAPGARLAWPTVGNEVFAVLPHAVVSRLASAGAAFMSWTDHMAVRPVDDGTEIIRLVTSWATTDDELDDFAALLA